MFHKCDCLTAKNESCKANGSHAVQHDDHIHDVCGAHRRQHNDTIKPVKFTNCTNARKVNTPLVTKQEALPMDNTDGLGHVAEIRKEMEMPKKIYTCNEVGCQNFEKMTADDHLNHMVTEHPVRAMVTGHTDLDGHDDRILSVMIDTIEGLKNTYGPRLIIVSGGALGADRLWALAAYKLGVPFEIYVPTGYGNIFVLQHKVEGGKWQVRADGRKLLTRWTKMLGLAAEVYDHNGKPQTIGAAVGGKYSKGANFRRNTTMVNVSQIHVAVSKEPLATVLRNTRWNGGTYHCIREMNRLGVKEVIWIPVHTQLKVTHTIHINEEK